MLAFIVRRLLALPIVLLGVSLAIAGLMQLLSPQQRAASFVTSPQQMRQLDRIIEQYGLNDPFHLQYGRWLGQVLRGNLGFSRASSEPVLTTLLRRLPATLELTLYAFLPIILTGVWLGSAAAVNRDTSIDHLTRVLGIVGWSLPTFVLGIWLLVVFYGSFGLLQPGQLSTGHFIEVSTGALTRYSGLLTLDALLNGRLDIFWDALKHLVLPVITLAAVSSAQIMRVMRSSLLEALSQDYVRTARAKGLSPRTVNNKHARRNALIPIVTLSSFILIALIGGAVIVETIFNYPGIGNWAARAAVQLDYPAILGFALLSAVIVVIGNLLADILYALVDPRISYG